MCIIETCGQQIAALFFGRGLMTRQKKPFLCKIGFHSAYPDSSFFNSVMRCSHVNCMWVSSKKDEATLNVERAAWRQVSDEGITGFGNQIVRVIEILDFKTETMDKRG